MKQLYHYFVKVRTDLKILLAISIVTFFIIELWLNYIPAIFNGADKVGEFFSRLSTSYIAAFIFYFLVVHIKNLKDKENINEFVGHKVYAIITSAHLLIQPLMQKFDPKARFKNLDSQELSQLLRSVDKTTNEAPFSIKGEKANWLQWYEYLKESTESNLSHILLRYNHLDSQLIKFLTRVENSLFFTQWNLLYNLTVDKTFGSYRFQIQSYLNLIEELKQYADKNFKEHEHITSDFIGKRGHL